MSDPSDQCLHLGMCQDVDRWEVLLNAVDEYNTAFSAMSELLADGHFSLSAERGSSFSSLYRAFCGYLFNEKRVGLLGYLPRESVALFLII